MEESNKEESGNGADEVQKKRGSCRKDDGPTIGGTDFQDPAFKKLAKLNGQVNKMTKDEIKAKLSELHLDTRGHKDVMKKRLKNYYKKKQLVRSSVSSVPKKSHLDYFIVIDFEATCEQNAVRYPHEIIEFPAVLIDASDGEVVDEFHSFVRPTRNSRLTEYCTELTSITQEQVDAAPTFVEVLHEMEEWMVRHHLGHGKKYAIVTDGPWDMGRFMFLQCRTSRIPFPRWAKRWVNIRKTYCNSYKVSRVNVRTMLEYLGLFFEGRQHCGLDDARNIGRILTHMIKDECSIYINERIFDSKLASIASAECDPEVVCVERDAESHDEEDVTDRLSLNENEKFKSDVRNEVAEVSDDSGCKKPCRSAESSLDTEAKIEVDHCVTDLNLLRIEHS